MNFLTPLVRYLCTTWASLHIVFAEMCPGWYISFESFLSILKGPREGTGGPLVQYLCKTKRLLHGRHVWEMLTLTWRVVSTHDENATCCNPNRWAVSTSSLWFESHLRRLPPIPRQAHARHSLSGHLLHSLCCDQGCSITLSLSVSPGLQCRRDVALHSWKCGCCTVLLARKDIWRSAQGVKNAQGVRNPIFITPEVSSVVESQLIHNRRSGIQTWDPGFLSFAGQPWSLHTYRYFCSIRLVIAWPTNGYVCDL